MTAPPRPRAEDQGAKDARLDDAALIERSWPEPEAFARLYDRHAALFARLWLSRNVTDLVVLTVAKPFRSTLSSLPCSGLRRPRNITSGSGWSALRPGMPTGWRSKAVPR
jgi:hypothetical protein